MLSECTAAHLNDIVHTMTEESLDIAMPKFSLETTSGAEKILAKSGLATMFTSKADFSGIMTDQSIHVGELQQHVSLRIDEGSSSENFLTSSNALRSNAQPDETILIDRPFAFLVRDVIDDMIIVAGKVIEPPAATEEPWGCDLFSMRFIYLGI